MFERLQELILLEDFKGCLPENLVLHLNEQKVSTLSEAAVFADEYVLTHRTVFFQKMCFHYQWRRIQGLIY